MILSSHESFIWDGTAMCLMVKKCVPIKLMLLNTFFFFLQSTGRGGTATHGNVDKIESMKVIKDKKITIEFVAETASAMRWKFKPLQQSVKVGIECQAILKIAVHPRYKSLMYNLVL